MAIQSPSIDMTAGVAVKATPASASRRLLADRAPPPRRDPGTVASHRPAADRDLGAAGAVAGPRRSLQDLDDLSLKPIARPRFHARQRQLGAICLPSDLWRPLSQSMGVGRGLRAADRRPRWHHAASWRPRGTC